MRLRRILWILGGALLALILSLGLAFAFWPAAHNPPSLLDDHSTGSRKLPSQIEFAQLVESDPIAALDASIQRYRQSHSGFTATFQKQERIGGKLLAEEVIRVSVKERDPYSVLMLWQKGGGIGQGTLYVQDQNENQTKVWMSRLFVKSVDPRGFGSRGAARYTIEEFGMMQSSMRTARTWKAVRDAGELKVDYLGEQSPVEAGGRKCFVFKRTCPKDEIDPFVVGEKVTVTDKNKADAFRTVTVYLDCETWLQVGTNLERADGELAGAYWFRDVQLDPVFDAETFTTKSFR